MSLLDFILGRTPAEIKKAEAKRKAAETARLQQDAIVAVDNRPKSRTAAVGAPAAPVALLGERATSGVVRVALPSGRTADEGWQALTPTSLVPVYAAIERENLADYIARSRTEGVSSFIAGDEGGLVLNYITPRAADEETDYYRLGGHLFTTLGVKRWPTSKPGSDYVPNPDFWDKLLGSLPTFTISMHHWAQRPASGIREIGKEIGRKKEVLREARKKSRGDSPEVRKLQDEVDDLTRTREEVLSRNIRLYHMSTYIRPGAADTPEELRDNVRAVHKAFTEVEGNGLSLISLPAEQRDAYVSSMPFGWDPTYLTMYRSASRAAEVFPLITRSHQQRNSTSGEVEGVLYGIHAINWTPVVMSPWRPDGSTDITCVLGRPGSGKSYWLRCHIGRLSMIGVTVFVIDPLSGYRRWFDNNQGQTISIAPGSDKHVNPFRRVWDANEGAIESPSLKAARLMPLYSLLLGDAFDKETEVFLDGVTAQFYANWKDDVQGEPLIGDFLTFLKGYGSLSKTGEKLSEGMVAVRNHLYDLLVLRTQEGNLSDLFAYPTNVDITSTRVYFDLSRSEQGEQRALAVYLAATIAVDQAKRDTSTRKLLVMDEMHEILNAAKTAPAIGQMIMALTRTLRHWNTAYTIATQFFDTETISPELVSILKTINSWVCFEATDAMQDQTLELLAGRVEPDIFRAYLKDRGSSSAQSRGQKKRMMVIRGDAAIPAYSVGLEYEDSEDAKSEAMGLTAEK